MKRVILTLVSVFFVLFIANAQTTTAPSENASGAEIKFDNIVHDYGTVQKGADGKCEFVFKNTGTEPLILSNVTTSCGCTVPSWPKEPILPGKTGAIKVTYTKMNTPGTISKQITVNSNASNGTIVLSIKGLVVDNTPATNNADKPANEKATPLK
ncbi:MAG TPA: DUF1573 domain-containing protein [Bacteroidales bacterium]|nr:DUF1573 domain-containing protein [Bacteroidales bacterium]HPS17871.1 DUF1573 domain-containing protein [Bacteroidales bacterium]